MSYNAITALAYETGKSGTSWTVDVTACNLSSDLTDKDFKVWIDDTLASNSDFTKTSAVLLTYSGASTSSAAVEVHRSTTVSRVKTITPGEALTVSDIENELNRILRIEAEIQAFYQADPPTGQAGYGEVLGTPYGSIWDGQIDLTATKGNLYDTIETQATLSSPTLTGVPECPDIANTLGSGDYTAANKDSTDAILQYRLTDQPSLTSSPSDTTDDSTLATTGFVKSSTRVIKNADVVDTGGTLDYTTSGAVLMSDSIDFSTDTYDLLVFCIRTNASPTSEPPTAMPTVGTNDLIDLDDSDASFANSFDVDGWLFAHNGDYSGMPVWYWAYFPALTGSHTVYWKGNASSTRSNINAEFRMQLIALPTDS